MTDADVISELKNWLIQQALNAVPRKDLLGAFCEELVRHGLPLLRMQLAQRALHPEFGGIGFTWTRLTGMNLEYFDRAQQNREDWYASPFYAVFQTEEREICADLTGDETQRFPIFAELRAMGGTSYFAHWKPVGPQARAAYDPDAVNAEGVLVSWTFDGDPQEAERFRDLIRGCFDTLVIVLVADGNREMGRSLLQVYLGGDAGDRVLSGDIRRGSCELIDAVICLFDLRGFTALSEQLSGPELVDLLNDYFGLVVEVIHAHGGDILKFLGDGVMAMFNLGALEEDAKAALRAVTELGPRMEELSAERARRDLPQAGYTMALHAGEILYGNIGASHRLDFTVIGPAVNLTARIADMHRTVERSVILSEDVRRAAGPEARNLVSLGRYMLRGVTSPIELFTIYPSQPDDG